MRLEIWTDVVCPWCYIGKRRLEAAFAQFEHADQVEIRWRSFELAPEAPRQIAESTVQHLAGKYGVPLAQAQQMVDRTTSTAAAEGLTYDFDNAQLGNSFDAHRLLHLAADRGVQSELEELLFRAHFTEGRSHTDPDSLVQIAVAAGLDEGEARTVVESDAYADDVRADEALARSFGISGVPFFVADRKFGVSGAQPAEVLLEMLRAAWAAADPITLVGGPSADDDSRSDGVCAV